MSKIKITTLTPIHIGSGSFLQYNTEFITTEKKISKERFVRVIDDRKILALVGEEHVNDWLLSIERMEDIKAFVKRYAPESKVTDYSDRCMPLFADDVKGTDTLKECIHDGFGVPYIPGSSIKGAIRTAVLASIVDPKVVQSKVVNKYGRISASEVEKFLFGKDPNADVFRFLHVGDAYFDKGSEIAIRLIMGLNVTQRDSLIPKNDTKPQLVEAIAFDENAHCQLKVATEYYSMAKKEMPDAIGDMPQQMTSVQILFELVNEHTLKLVEEEMAIWEEYKNRIGADEYIEKMHDILATVKQCKLGECVLRIGHASGWRFITGAWAEDLSNFDTDIVSASRPQNAKYSEYMFPKSRRLDSDGELVGFVKLSLQS